MVTKVSKKADTSVKISKANARSLKTLKGTLKVSSIDDVVTILQEDRVKLKKARKKVNELETKIAMLGDTPPQEAPTVPNTQQQDVKDDVESIKTHPCSFYSFDGKTSKVHCSRDYAKRGVIHKISKEVCNQCWKQREPTRKESEVANALFRQAMIGDDPFKNFPCPYNARRTDPNMQLVYCAKRMKQGGTITEKQVRYFSIKNVGQCQNCISIFKGAQALKEADNKQKALNRELNKQPRVDWKKAEGAPSLFLMGRD